MNVKKFFAIAISTYASCFVIGAACSGEPVDLSTPAPIFEPIELYPPIQQVATTQQITEAQELETTTTQLATTTTLSKLNQIDPDTKCQEWLPLAVQVGWPDDPRVLQRLGQVMWKESRCQPEACSKSDKGRQCRDYGLIQGNWYAHHEWWAELGIAPEQMLEPATNLRWAYLLYSGREAQGKCGWQPWSLSC